MKRRISTLLLLAFLLAQAQAGVQKLTLPELCSGAERIVVGGVTKLTPRWEGSMIVTDVTIAPAEHLKGAATGPFVVTIPGGTVGATTMRASEAPVFAIDETVVLFVRKVGPCGVYGWFRGKYTVVGDQIRELKGTTFAQLRSEIIAEVEKQERR